MYIHTYRFSQDGKSIISHTKHMHPSDVKALAILVRLLFGLCCVLALGMFAAAYFGDETLLTDTGLTIGGLGFLGMAIRLRKTLRSVKQIPTSATKPKPPTPVAGKPVTQQPSQTVQAGGERRPQDFRRDHQDNQQRPRCQVCKNSKLRDDGQCLSSDNYFSRSATIRIPDRPCTEQGANDNYFSRSGRQSGLPSGSVSGYALLAG